MRVLALMNPKREAFFQSSKPDNMKHAPKKQIKVSVLVPAFNEEMYLRKTLLALMDQDYPDFEVIVVDNASTDNTSRVVEQFIQQHEKAGEIFTLAYEGSQGTQFAREKGRSLARGAIIAQLDADCVPSRQWISRGVVKLMRHDVVAVTGPYDYFDSPFLIRVFTLLSQFTLLKFLNQVVQLAKRGGIIIGGNAFIKAVVLEATGGYNTSLTFYGDDVDIALRVSREGKILFSNKLLLKTSSRRYLAQGFLKVQRKYSHFFFRSVFSRGELLAGGAEIFHPR